VAVIFTILFLVQCQREREKEGEKETPYSIHIFLFSAREKERKETHLCQSKTNFLFVSSAILVAIENAIILSGELARRKDLLLLLLQFCKFDVLYFQVCVLSMFVVVIIMSQMFMNVPIVVQLLHFKFRSSSCIICIVRFGFLCSHHPIAHATKLEREPFLQTKQIEGFNLPREGDNSPLQKATDASRSKIQIQRFNINPQHTVY
jgi:hypothetical protein